MISPFSIHLALDFVDAGVVWEPHLKISHDRGDEDFQLDTGKMLPCAAIGPEAKWQECRPFYPIRR